MQSISVSLTIAVFLALIALLVAATAAPVEIVGALQNVNGSSIAAIQEEPYVIFATYEAEEDGRFRFTGNSMGALVLHGRSMEHPPAERVIAARTTVSFTVPLSQDVQVRIVDAEGKAVEGAEPWIRYYEPKKPSWRVRGWTEEGEIPRD